MIARPRKSSNGTKPTNGAPAPVRVAVYCRKSVDKGNGGEFGSIEAQREAVEAYVASQRGNGWSALPEHYDDLGLSGKNTGRPAFQRLLTDVRDGRVDLVAVYRLDRLSRSQRDFLDVLDLFERHGVQFVSITEHFDTSTPMGRFALGILIQVAQLEREVTAERVRDKVVASRRRGMWTGGQVPLGYTSQDGKLVVNRAEAETVREIFAAFLAAGSVTGTLDALRERGVTARGCRVFTKASLRNLLANPVVAGMVRAGDDVVEAQHDAVVDRETWDRAQELLTCREPRARRLRRPSGALLSGLLRCGVCGAAMVQHATSKRTKGYRYYACHRRIREGAAACPGSTVPAAALETFVVEKIRAVGRDPSVLTETVAAARAQLAARGPEIDRERQRLKDEKRRLDEESECLAAAIAEGGDAKALCTRLDRTAAALEEIASKAEALLAEKKRLKSAVIDEAELTAAVAAFAPVWEHLLRDERQRLLRLLIEEVRYDAAAGEATIQFDPEGFRLLAREQEDDAT
jgi:site-specific DNA recombinase